MAGCSVGPNYKTPDAQVPGQWSTTRPAGTTTQPAEVLTTWWTNFDDPMLNSLVERAMLENLDLREAQARVRESRALRSIATSGLFPIVDASGSYSHSRRSANATRTPGRPSGLLGLLSGLPGFSFQPLSPAASSITLSPGQLPFSSVGSAIAVPFEQDLYQTGFDASWELDVFGGVRRNMEATRADLQAAEEGRRDVLVSLLAEVGRNYTEIRGLQQRLIVARNNIAAQQESVEVSQAKYKAGQTGELDVLQAKAQLASTQSEVPLLETSLRRAIHRLGVLIGKPPGELVPEFEQSAPIPALPPGLPEVLPCELLRRRPDIRRAERELAAATARIGVATADLFPRFSLNGSFSVQSADISKLLDRDSQAWSIGPSMRWRIFDAGAILSNIEVQNARQEQALNRYRKVVLSSLEEVENALTAYMNDRIRHETLSASVEANRQAVELAQDGYRRGLTQFDFLRVIEAQRSLFLAEQQLIESQQAVVADLIVLYKALGGGWDQSCPDPKCPTSAPASSPSP